MGFEEKVWKWYDRHDNAINAVLEIACVVIPGAPLVFQALKAAHAAWKDHRENQGDDKLNEVEQFLVSVKPMMQDFVEEVEDHKAFRQSTSAQERQVAIQQHLSVGLQGVLSQISASVSLSASRLTGKDGGKEVLNEKYELVSLLGSGGQGSVYQAKDLEADKLVAVKMLPPILSNDTMAIASLRQEYNRVVDLLVHANIVQYRSMAQDTRSKRWFLVMDYVAGKNLRQWMLEHRKPMGFRQAADFLMPVADALDFAHNNKVVHCDLKPENILLRDSDGRMMLTDFGLAREIRASLSKRSAQGDISGTLPYMAPEQYLGRNPDARTDIWALGVVMYELVAGFHPFQGTSFEHFKDLICNVAVERPDNLTSEEWARLDAMLQKDRSKRPAVAKEAMRGKSKPISKPIDREVERLRKEKQVLEQELKKHREETARIQRAQEKAKRATEAQRQAELKSQQEATAKPSETELERLLAELTRQQEAAQQAELKLKQKAARRKAKTWFDSRYKTSKTGVILDTKTNLEWYVGPDQDTTQDEAKSWTASLTVDGGGWRMPTIEELRGLYQNGKGSRNIDPIFVTYGWWIWSCEIDYPFARHFAFGLRFGDSLARADSYSYRCFCVRPGRRRQSDFFVL